MNRKITAAQLAKAPTISSANSAAALLMWLEDNGWAVVSTQDILPGNHTDFFGMTGTRK